ncbi:MAG: hypothetical protein JST39_15375 [Bacteroidetes bacterium]|nr:hypothetical protein [Bacteroidota bacterium]
MVNKADAQIRVSVNIGAQPEWGPSGYDYAEYYYLPDIEAYYCVPTRQYTYFNDGRWVTAGCLPYQYRNYDLYGGYKVVLNERNPWMHFNNHRSMYAPYRYRHDQVVIRDYRSRNDNGRFYDNRGWHRGWDKDRGYGWNDRGGYDRGNNGNGRGNGWNNGHGRGHDRDRGGW